MAADDIIVSVAVRAGTSAPAQVDKEFIDALDQVVVRQLDDGTSTFQLVFNLDQPQRLTPDFPLVAKGTVAPGSRVKIAVVFGSTQQGVADGVIAHQELVYDAERGGFVYSVIGEDLSVYMRLEEKAAEWPARSASQIVTELLNNYTQYGITAKVVTPQNDFTPTAQQWVRQQNSTDLSFARALGRQFGYVFALRPGKDLDANSTAYWGPPARDGSPLPPLNVDLGSSSNVRSIEFGYEPAAAQLYKGGSRVDADSNDALSVASSTDFALEALAGTSSLKSTLLRTRRFVEPSLSGALATAYADALTQTSARAALRARAVVDGFFYGRVVTPSNILPVRGTGKAHDGLYYVERVDHKLRRGAYTQEIVMTREGTGSTITEVSA